jgi:hypothetical protein
MGMHDVWFILKGAKNSANISGIEAAHERPGGIDGNQLDFRSAIHSGLELADSLFGPGPTTKDD